jgi:hypothetical protein
MNEGETMNPEKYRGRIQRKFRNPVGHKKAQKAQKQTPSSEFGHQTGFTYRLN